MEWIKSLKQYFKKENTDGSPSVNNSVVIFSGLFSYSEKQKKDIQKRCGYYQAKPAKDVRSIIQNQYYQIFRKFILNDCHDDYLEICSPNSYKISIETGSEFKVEVKSIRLSFFDDNIRLGIYSFSVRSIEDLSFKEFIQAVGKLRILETRVSVEKQNLSMLEFIELNMLRCESNPLTNNVIKIGEKSEVYDYSGSKLKAFIAVELGEFKEGYTIDEALFELGTFTEYSTSRKNQGLHSPSLEYFNSIVSNKISVFNNWSGLALFDSFIIIGQKDYLENPGTLETITGSYFKIFLFNLYSKYYLFKANSSLGNSDKRGNDKKLYNFLRKYDITHISYNFLPNLIHSKMREALQIDTELKSVKSKIELIESQEKEKETNLINAILLFIALLSIVSVLADFPEVFENVSEIKDDKTATYIAAVVVFIAIVALFCYYKVYKKK